MASPVRSGQVRLTDTIFALSSGRPPAAIGVVRISGSGAFPVLKALAGSIPPPRTAVLRGLSFKGEAIDHALVLAFPGPNSATGEDLVELHCHGGRAVIAAVESALGACPGMRRAEPGEFTRRALANGRIDLLQAEGLADLLEAETEVARRAAMMAVEGRLSGLVRSWLDRVTMLSARAEALLDYSDEDDVSADAEASDTLRQDAAMLAQDIERALEAPSVERLRDGVRVVIAGPPNAGKSTLLNRLVERDVAIVTSIAGTTRDRVEAPVLREGVPLLLVDTAGIAATDDVVEAIGIDRAHEAIAAADILLWLGDDVPPRVDAIRVHARSDLPDRAVMPPGADVAVSADDERSLAKLWSLVMMRARRHVVGVADAPAMQDRQRRACRAAVQGLALPHDLLLAAEGLATSRRALTRLLGIDDVDSMLDSLFARFCVGK